MRLNYWLKANANAKANVSTVTVISLNNTVFYLHTGGWVWEFTNCLKRANKLESFPNIVTSREPTYSSLLPAPPNIHLDKWKSISQTTFHKVLAFFFSLKWAWKLPGHISKPSKTWSTEFVFSSKRGECVYIFWGFYFSDAKEQAQKLLQTHKWRLFLEAVHI